MNKHFLKEIQSWCSTINYRTLHNLKENNIFWLENLSNLKIHHKMLTGSEHRPQFVNVTKTNLHGDKVVVSNTKNISKFSWYSIYTLTININYT